MFVAAVLIPLGVRQFLTEWVATIIADVPKPAWGPACQNRRCRPAGATGTASRRRRLWLDCTTNIRLLEAAWHREPSTGEIIATTGETQPAFSRGLPASRGDSRRRAGHGSPP